MKRILVLTPRLPFPAVGGDRLRIYNICKVLAEDHRLTLLSYCETREEMEYPIPEDGVFSAVHRVRLRKSRSLAGALISLITGAPLQVGYYKSLRMRRKVDQLMPECDAVLVHLIRMAQYVEDAPKHKVLEMTDAISLNYQRVRAIVGYSTMRSVVYSIESKRLCRFEERCIRKFDKTVVVSDVDRDHLFRRAVPELRDRVLVCSNGVDLTSFPYGYAPDGRTIIFIGNMVTLQNLDAACYFAECILPLVRKRVPGAAFKVIGRIGRSDAERLGGYSGVTVTGAVTSVAAAAAGAAAGVCPMRLGAGIQNKILEYMALGIPAVVSSIGAEGLHAVPGRDLIVADSVETVAGAIADMLLKPRAYEDMARSARKYVEDHHSWVSTLGDLRAQFAGPENLATSHSSKTE